MTHGAMVAIHAASAAAAAAKAQTKALDAFRTHDATSPARSRTLVDIGLSGDDRAIRELIGAGVIRGVDTRGRLTVLGDSIDRVAGYYLDEMAYIAHRDGTHGKRAQRALLAVACVLLAALTAALLVFLTKR